jgi:hypothetical protein
MTNRLGKIVLTDEDRVKVMAVVDFLMPEWNGMLLENGTLLGTDMESVHWFEFVVRIAPPLLWPDEKAPVIGHEMVDHLFNRMLERK